MEYSARKILLASTTWERGVRADERRIEKDCETLLARRRMCGRGLKDSESGDSRCLEELAHGVIPA